jgi:hypothetical protein
VDPPFAGYDLYHPHPSTNLMAIEGWNGVTGLSRRFAAAGDFDTSLQSTLENDIREMLSVT